ncbi:MAG: hypothetical protein RLZZ546_2106 [Bacteroidota bacterium]
MYKINFVLIFVFCTLKLEAQNVTSFQLLKKYFIEGDWVWMSPVLIVFIFGLAFCIERIITLNLATIDTDKFLSNIDLNLKNNSIDKAMQYSKNVPGPAASIIHEGLKNIGKGPENVEKAIINYGSVQMGLMEKGLVWISLFISLAPMLGFLGTVVGMIQAFEKIEAAGDLSPSIVAGGIKVALLTTVFGLIVAMVLQVFYNYIVSKINSLTNDMEDTSIQFMDILHENKLI